MSCRVYSPSFFDSFESKVEIPSISAIMREIVTILDRVKSKSDQRPTLSSGYGSSASKRWKGKSQSSTENGESFDTTDSHETEEPFELVSKKSNKTSGSSTFIRQRTDVTVLERKSGVSQSSYPKVNNLSVCTGKDKFSSSQNTQRTSLPITKSQKLQIEKEINFILNGVTDKEYEPNAKRLEKLFKSISHEEEKKSAEVYLLNTIVSLACKQLLFARSYALLLSTLDSLFNVKQDLEKLISVKFELLTTLDTEKSMTKMNCKSFAVFYSFLMTSGMTSIEKAVTMLNELFTYYESYEDHGGLAIEFICTFLCSLKKENDSATLCTFLPQFESLLLRLNPHFTKTSLSAMRLLDVKDCFSL